MLAAAETPTQFFIPVGFEVTDKGGIGDINIKLENAVNPDGFSGWTSSIVDEINNQILKSDITIYQTNDYSDNQLAAVFRHEIGHALGLAHSTAPEDLMAPTMTTEFPHISNHRKSICEFIHEDSDNINIRNANHTANHRPSR